MKTYSPGAPMSRLSFAGWCQNTAISELIRHDQRAKTGLHARLEMSLPDDTSDSPSQLDEPTHTCSQSKDTPVVNFQLDEAPEIVTRPKRNACMVCRKRKLRCDGGQPSCGTCTRLNHDCNYIESRRRSGPKRGYVKTLETRLGLFLASAKLQFSVYSLEPYAKH
jgi:hypothetical protein